MTSLPTPGTNPSADVSVRVAWSDDATAIAAVQVAVWSQEYQGLLPQQAIDTFEVDAFAEAWAASLGKPTDARNRVLVALERNSVRGFAVTGALADPDADPVSDGEIVEFFVAPQFRRQGHGSRLMQACIDTLSADRFTTAHAWLRSGDDIRRGFFTAGGWEPDGAHRELDLDGTGAVLLKQVRLHTGLTESS